MILCRKISDHNRNRLLLHVGQVYIVYPILTTRLVWPCIRNQSTIICAIVDSVSVQSSIFFNYKGSERHLTLNTTQSGVKSLCVLLH